MRAIGPTVRAGEALKHKHTHSKTIYMDGSEKFFFASFGAESYLFCTLDI